MPVIAMHFLPLLIVVTSLTHTATSHPQTQVESQGWGPYIPPGPDDVRSPCPGLNSAANHGFLPRSGKGMTLPILANGLRDALNIGEDFSLAIGGAGLFSNPNQDPLNPFFNLDQLQLHNFPIEHDASLSRGEKFFGNNLNFNATIWKDVLRFVPEDQDFQIKNSAMARYNRVKVESARDPTFTYMPQHFLFSYGETALYLSAMGSSATATSAPREYVRSFFEQEKLPYELGWRKSPTRITLGSLGWMVGELFAATGEELPEGLLITETTLKAAFSGINPVTGLPGNATP